MFEMHDDSGRVADGFRSERIAEYLLSLPAGELEVGFNKVVDDALYAETFAWMRGEYPPAGHEYPREGRP
jgi:hypothetical protein